MAKQVMRRRASDNQYLHRDFHGALSAGIDYLDRHYGEEAVRRYLHEFTLTYYAPLRASICERGLAALKEYFEDLYKREGADATVSLTEDELLVSVPACPAVTHMRRNGYAVARLFHETTRTVSAALCEGTRFTAELVEYDPATGRSVQRFTARES